MNAQDNNLYPTEYRLFHIERSLNRNLVCYDINLTDGVPDKKNPIYVYWRNREKEPGKKSDLTAIQRKYAYGYKLISSSADSFEITLKPYDAKTLTVKKQGQKYICVATINNHPAILQSLYVKSQESNSLKVEYIELRGIQIDTGAPLTEKVENK